MEDDSRSGSFLRVAALVVVALVSALFTAANLGMDLWLVGDLFRSLPFSLLGGGW